MVEPAARSHHAGLVVLYTARIIRNYPRLTLDMKRKERTGGRVWVISSCWRWVSGVIMSSWWTWCTMISKRELGQGFEAGGAYWSLYLPQYQDGTVVEPATRFHHTELAVLYAAR